MALTEIFWVIVALGTIAPVFYVNRPLYGKDGVGTSGLETVYYVVGIVALLCGWYFNFAYFREYGAEAGWWHWTKLLFVNSASASGAQDLIIANVILFPLWTIYEGRRQKMKLFWWYFPLSLFTSFAFAMALFLALHDRQQRFNAVSSRA